YAEVPQRLLRANGGGILENDESLAKAPAIQVAEIVGGTKAVGRHHHHDAPRSGFVRKAPDVTVDHAVIGLDAGAELLRHILLVAGMVGVQKSPELVLKPVRAPDVEHGEVGVVTVEELFRRLELDAVHALELVEEDVGVVVGARRHELEGLEK